MMQDFLNKVGKTAADVANKAGNKASELIEVGKLKSRISVKKQEAVDAEREIGKYCYSLFEQGKIDDSVILEFCETIKSCRGEIADLEQQVQAAKDANNEG